MVESLWNCVCWGMLGAKSLVCLAGGRRDDKRGHAEHHLRDNCQQADRTLQQFTREAARYRLLGKIHQFPKTSLVDESGQVKMG